MINKSIIREYDIRGIYEKTLNVQDAFLVGWSLAQYLNKTLSRIPIVNVCRDGRLSSPALVDSLIDGLRDGGANVVDIGLGPTPMLYFSNFVTNADAGIMVTGSHNPADYNGFKFIVDRNAFFGAQIQNLQHISQCYNSIEPIEKGSLSEDNIMRKYIDVLVDGCKDAKDFKIAWDAGNGATGEVIERLVKLLPGQHILLNTEIDGAFPAHHPDPTVPKNLEQIIKVVLENKCDFGLAFDGDGDRIGIVDDLGRIVWGDQLLVMLAKDILSRIPGAPIIADVKASQVVFDQIKLYGGTPVMWKTGHSNIKKHMKEIGSPLAGEMSGHIFIADQYYGYDDALYAAVRLINLLSQDGLSLSEILDSLPKAYNTPEIRIECKEEEKFLIIEKLKAHFKDNKIPFNDIDGIRYFSKTGWGLIRASNTQAVLVCRFEADSKQEVDEEISFMSKLLREYDLELSEV